MPFERRRNDAGEMGKVYDVDAPGNIFAPPPTGAPPITPDTYRHRANYKSYAVLNAATNNTAVSAAPLLWYSRTSCSWNGTATSLATDFAAAGDNVAAIGTTNTSANFQ